MKIRHQLPPLWFVLTLVFCHAYVVQEDIFAHCDFVQDKSDTLKGTADFKMMAGFSAMNVRVNLTGFDPYDDWVAHGLHVHEYGDLSGGGCDSMGDHFDPDNTAHGDRNWLPYMRHVGDFGNVLEDGRGNVLTAFTDYLATLGGEHSIIGRGLIVHEHEDDLTDGPFMGSAGFKLGCCIIGLSDGSHWHSRDFSLPVPGSYQPMK